MLERFSLWLGKESVRVRGTERNYETDLKEIPRKQIPRSFERQTHSEECVIKRWLF